MTGQQPAQDVLTRLLAQNYYISRTASGEPFAVHNDAPSVMIRLRGMGGLRQRLAVDMLRATGRAPSNDALATVLNLAEGIAYAKTPVQPHLRIAAHLGKLYLDLGRPDGHAVELCPGRWSVVSRPPVLFARTSLSAELPLPADRGDLDGARDLINVGGQDEWALYTACRVASLFPGITHPIELITGPSGSAKTSTTRMTANWIDPSPVMVPVPRDGRTWAAIGASRLVLPVDNVSYIPAWWSDLLCKAASGDGWVDRALYSDGDVFVSSFQSVVLLNGISLPALRGDLADRIAWHKLTVPHLRASDDELEHRWKKAWPSALAWLLDRACEIFADMASMPSPEGSDRLVRFGQVVKLIDHRWRTRAYPVWQNGRSDVLEDVVDSDPIAVAIRNAVTQPLMATSTELLARLRMSGLSDEGRSAWTPKGLSERLERSQAALEALGWRIWRYREGHSGKRMWAIAPPGYQTSQIQAWPQ